MNSIQTQDDQILSSKSCIVILDLYFPNLSSCNLSLQSIREAGDLNLPRFGECIQELIIAVDKFSEWSIFVAQIFVLR